MAVFVVADPVGQHEAVLSLQLSASPASLESPAAPSSILSRLRLESRAEHEAVEKVLDLMSASLTRESYSQKLQQFYGFYAPLEKALQNRSDRKAGGVDAPLSVATRAALAARLTKTDCLRQDLRHFGVTAEELPLCHDLPPLGNQADVLGCLYVLEGATLGGRMITLHVQSTLGITPIAGGTFFEGYGARTGTMWQTMRHLLVSAALDTPTENAMVASAIATFSCLRLWCESGMIPSATSAAAQPTTRHA